MKRILLVLISFLLALLLVACTDGQSNNSSDSSTSSVSQGGSADSTGESTNDQAPGDEPQEPDRTGGILTQAVINQLDEAASMKLELSLDLECGENSWELNDSGWAENYTGYFEGKAIFTLYVTAAEDRYDLKLEASVRSRDDEHSPYETDIDGAVLYIVDGYVYEYNEPLDSYLLSTVPKVDLSCIADIFEAFMDETGVSEEEVNSALNTLGNELIEVLGISNNRGFAQLDYAEAVNSELEYLSQLDLEKTTVKELLERLIKSYGEELTVEDLLKDMEEYLGMTFGEYLELQDTEYIEKYGKTTAEMYEFFLNNESVHKLLEEYIRFSYPGIEDESIDEVIAQLISIDFDSYFDETMKEMTIYGLMLSLMGDEGVQEEMPSLEELVTNINLVLDYTLAEAEDKLGIPFSGFAKIVSYITVDNYDMSLDIEFEGIYRIKSLVADLGYGFTFTAPSNVSGKSNTLYFSAGLSASVKEISSNKKPIYAPTDKDVLLNLFDKEYYSFDGAYCLSLTAETDGIMLIVYDADSDMLDESLDGVKIIASPSKYDFDENQIIVPRERIYLFDEEVPLSVTFILDTDNGLFEYIITVCNHAYGAWWEEDDGSCYRECVLCGNLEYREPAVVYTVTYHNVDGAQNPNKTTFRSGEGEFVLQSAEKSGYLFAGWYLDEELTISITSIIPTEMEWDIDLFAAWEELQGPPVTPGEEDESNRWRDQTLNILATTWNNSTAAAPWSQLELVIKENPSNAIYNYGQIINSAVYDREEFIYNEYGVTLNFINARTNQISTLLAEALVSGRKYHIAMPRMLEAQTIVAANSVYSISSSKYIDLDASYYNQAAREAYTVNGTTLFAAGDFSFLDEQTTNVVFFNQALSETQSQLPDLYKLVREGKWTIDEMINAARLVEENVGSAQWTDDDVYGFGSTNITKFYQYSGIQQVSVVDGVYAVTLNDKEKVNALIDKLLEITDASWARLEWTGGFGAMQDAFSQGRLLFYDEVVQKIETFSSFSADFKPAVLPVPKLNTEQEKYTSPCSYQSVLMCIPKATPDREMSEYFFEVLSFTGKEYIMRAYKQRVLSQLYYGYADESREMLEEYIFPSIVYDVGYMHNWNGLLTDVQADSYADGRNNFASAYSMASEDAITTVENWNRNWLDYTE